LFPIAGVMAGGVTHQFDASEVKALSVCVRVTAGSAA
jgi:hypothetical protein